VPSFEINAKDFPLPENSRYRNPRDEHAQRQPRDPGTSRSREFDLNGNETGRRAGLQRVRFAGARLRRDVLLIGMLMGVSLALIDRTRVGHARAPALGLGAASGRRSPANCSRRFVVGFAQMTRAVRRRWVLFGISLGHVPRR